MHETVLVAKIIAQAKRKKPLRGVKGIVLRVGDLATVKGPEIREKLVALTGWKVKIVKEAARVKCACGFTGKPSVLERGHDFVLFICPNCQSVPRIVKGGGLDVMKVTA